MRLNIIMTFIICTSLSAAAWAEAHAAEGGQLMFVGSVVRAPCAADHIEQTLTFACLNNASVGIEVERYDVASLAGGHILRSKYKTIEFLPIKSKPGLVRMIVAYD